MGGGAHRAALQLAEKVAGNRAFYASVPISPVASRQVVRRHLRKQAKAEASRARHDVVKNRRKKAVAP